MPTTIHIPEALLQAVDARAQLLGVSRNRLIIRALQRLLNEGSKWSPEFLGRLRLADEDTSDAVDEMLIAIKSARRLKSADGL